MKKWKTCLALKFCNLRLTYCVILFDIDTYKKSNQRKTKEKNYFYVCLINQQKLSSLYSFII